MRRVGCGSKFVIKLSRSRCCKFFSLIFEPESAKKTGAGKKRTGSGTLGTKLKGPHMIVQRIDV